MLLLDGAKLAIYGIFLNYYCYYIIRGAFIPHGTMIFLGIAAICILFSILGHDGGRIYIGKELTMWGVYGLLAFGLSFTFSNMNQSALMSDIFKYFQRLLLIFFISYICEKEGSIRFGLRALIVSAVGCTLAVFSTLGSYQLKLDITSGADVSTNDIGALMAFGIIAILIYGGHNNRQSPVIISALKLAISIGCTCVIFLAGSRKSITAVIIFLLFVVIFCGSDFFRNLTPIRFFCLVIIFAIAIFFIYQYLWQYVDDTNLYVRMFGRGVERTATSDDIRKELYLYALQDFIKHPLIGDGFNNFANLHGLYTHSTYAEPLACSGIVGLLYLLPYVRLFFNQLNIIQVYPKETSERTWQKSIMAFFVAFAFVGIGIPYLYKDIPCILLGMFLASQELAFTDIYYS